MAVAPVERFHWLDEIKELASSKTLNSAVLGPELPWFKAVKSILLKPLESGNLNPEKLDSKYKL